MTFWLERGGCGKVNLNGLRGARGFSMRSSFSRNLMRDWTCAALEPTWRKRSMNSWWPSISLLLVPIGLDSLFVGFLALFEVGRVVAGVGNEFRGVRIDLDDGLDDGVHEVAVVGNHQDGAGVVEQVALEPEQREQVEVVGRLVEHEQVRLHDEELGEVGAHHPAAGVFAGGLVEVVLV